MPPRDAQLLPAVGAFVVDVNLPLFCPCLRVREEVFDSVEELIKPLVLKIPPVPLRGQHPEDGPGQHGAGEEVDHDTVGDHRRHEESPGHTPGEDAQVVKAVSAIEHSREKLTHRNLRIGNRGQGDCR